MRSFATLVLYERHGHPTVGYRAETIDQIARGDMAEGTHGAWELRCWTPTGGASGSGVTSDELVALVDAFLRTIRHCLDDASPLDAIQRFHCPSGGAVVRLPEVLPLAEHLANWSNSAPTNGVFLQASHLSTEKLRVIGYELQREIAAMAKVKDELFGDFHSTATTE